MLVTAKPRERESMDGWKRTDASDRTSEESGCAELHARSADSADTEEGIYEARRLTPTECARLQGFPDDWCADVPHTDSAEYKLWGNGIALPCLLPMFKAMKKILEGV
jgi:site-specific DNA-cytosine methylase